MHAEVLHGKQAGHCSPFAGIVVATTVSASSQAGCIVFLGGAPIKYREDAAANPSRLQARP
ncbi:hypothetical protein PG987_005397 [Apiospora arundinis]